MPSMTDEEFNAVLAVEGRRVVTVLRAGFASADNTYVARVVEPVTNSDTNEGPYRNSDMVRVILEIASDTSFEAALDLLKQFYSEGRYMK